MLHPQWEIFFQVVESGSFARAAGARSCSPVAIMNQVNALEERLGIRLLERSSRGVRLTAAGESLHADALRLREAARRAVVRAKAAGPSGTPVLRVGTSLLRPCTPLLAHLERLAASWRGAFRIDIVPFNDSPRDFSRLQQRLGTDIDCFVSPCDSAAWKDEFGLFRLGTCACCVSLPATHRLAAKTRLSWRDLDGETLMLVERGLSPTIDRLREDIRAHHPALTILDAPGYYDIDVFNKCAQAGYLMEVPEIWAAGCIRAWSRCPWSGSIHCHTGWSARKARRPRWSCCSGSCTAPEG